MVACNGGPLPLETALMFSPLQCQFLPRPNDEGWDIAAFQSVAHKFPCDMLVCLGESVYFHKPNWLVPIVEAWKKFGPGFYGFFSSFLVRPHLNTTAFACDPRFLNGYPRVSDHYHRYQFEHGKDSMWSRFAKFGRPVKLVTWESTYDQPQWRYGKNIMWHGDQSDCLVYCNHVDRWASANAETKSRWTKGADGLNPTL